MIAFLYLIIQAKKFGLRHFHLKLYRHMKISGKTESYYLSTQQWQQSLSLELLLPGPYDESEWVKVYSNSQNQLLISNMSFNGNELTVSRKSLHPINVLLQSCHFAL